MVVHPQGRTTLDCSTPVTAGLYDVDIPTDDRWGYVTTGGSEGTEYGLLLARTLYPDAITYFSDQAHYSVPKILAKLRMPAVAISAGDDGTGKDGGLDLDDLRDAIRQRRQHPPIVLATTGPTMT